MLSFLFFLVTMYIITKGINLMESYSKSKKECTYHHWMFKKDNGLECSICGKIVRGDE